MTWLSWRAATSEALYGSGGFYRRPEGPAGHFRTSVHASPFFAVAVLALARAAGLGRVVDMGAGRGELLRTLHRLDPALELHGVEVAARPAELPDAISWSATPPELPGALLFANEWLDNVPVDVVEVSGAGPRVVEVRTTTGEQRLAAPPSPEDLAWLERWWPLGEAEAGDRAEIGRPRDDAWAATLGSLRDGIAVAVDYAHVLGGRPPFGTLSGYREGRGVDPVPDGSCDITAHVAIDACAAAGEVAGASATVLTTQRDALRALGIRGQRPPFELSRTDPQTYLRRLQAAGQQGELLDPHGLGGFRWLVQCVDVDLPAPLTTVPNSRSDTRP